MPTIGYIPPGGKFLPLAEGEESCGSGGGESG